MRYGALGRGHECLPAALQPSSTAELERGAASAARAVAAKQSSPREQAYAKAISTFYEKPATLSHATRALAYEAAMADVHARYPGDDEASAFYALAILGAAAVAPSDTLFVRQKQAAKLLNGVAARHPRHPGIAHYFIHAYDAPELAALALTEARSYAAISAANIRWENYRWSESNVYYAVALGAAHTGNLARAREEVARLESMYQELKGKDTYAGLIDAQRRAVSAWIAETEDRSSEALALARSAADLEESIEKHPVTPGMVLPTRELLDDLLLTQQPAEALRAYEATLKHSPRRFNSVAGAMRAAERSGARALAVRYARELLVLSAHADSVRPEIAEAKRLTVATGG